jgi:putative endopeptidase
MEKVRPQDDFYLYMNGERLEKAIIPADKPLTGSFVEISLRNEEVLSKDLLKFAQEGIDKRIYDDEIFDRFLLVYKQALDKKKRDEDGDGFIVDLLKKVDGVKSAEDLSELSIEFLKEGLPTVINFMAYADMKDATTTTLYLSAPRLFLPEKGYYDEKSSTYQRGVFFLAKFKEVILKLFETLKVEGGEKIVEGAFAFDKALVPLTKSAEEQSNYVANYNPYAYADLKAKLVGFDFDSFAKEVIGKDIEQVIVTDPRFVEGYAALIKQVDLESIKSWLKVSLVYMLATSGAATDDIRVIASSYAQLITGQREISSFEKYTYRSLSSRFSDVVGLYFGKRYFGEAAKKDVEKMVHEFIFVYQKRLAKIDRLTKETRDRAILKLSKIKPMIGYPSKIHDAFLKFVPDEKKTYSTNMMAFFKEETAQNFATYKTKVDRDLWGMGAFEVNAYYNPNTNVIVFPAGILQDPFYSYTQARGRNYGGIGSVIAHEITHAFDTNGAAIDENGNINNRRKKEDYEKFSERAKKMVALFDGLEVPGTKAKCNGQLTVTENIADQGGVSCAYEAASAYPDFNPKDFFEGFATIWRIKASPEFMELLANVDVHAPGRLRATVQLKNFKPFEDYYRIKPGDGMYLDPAKRATIW